MKAEIKNVSYDNNEHRGLLSVIALAENGETETIIFEFDHKKFMCNGRQKFRDFIKSIKMDSVGDCREMIGKKFNFKKVYHFEVTE